MISVKFAALIAATAAVSGTFGQQPAKISTKPVSAANTPKLGAVESMPVSSSPSPTPFQPVRWQADAPIAGYMPNQPDKVYGWVESLVANIPGKPDKFSSEAERLSYESRLESAMRETASIPIVGNCGSRKYDPQKQVYKFEIQAHRVDRSGYAFSSSSPPRTRDLAALQGGFDIYKIQDRWLSYDVALSLVKSNTQQLNWIDFANEAYIPNWFIGQFEFEAPLAASDARRDDDSIRCIFLLKILPPGIFEYKSSGARTIESKSIFGKLEAIFVVNAASGDLLFRTPKNEHLN